MSQEENIDEAPPQGKYEQPIIHFSIQAERWLGQDARFVSWCPTMDLIAIVYADNSVCIHRLSYERLYILPKVEKDITALEWRPDGKALILGYQDGSKSLWNIENGEQLASIEGGGTIPNPTQSVSGSNHATVDMDDDAPVYQFKRDDEDNDSMNLSDAGGGRRVSDSFNTSSSGAKVEPTIEDYRIHKSEIQGMSWSQDQKSLGSLANLTYFNRVADVLPPLKHFDDSEDKKSGQSLQKHQSLIFGTQSTNLNVLISYDASGDVVFTSHGIFALGRINILNLLQEMSKARSKAKWTVREFFNFLVRKNDTLRSFFVEQKATVVSAAFTEDMTRLLLVIKASEAAGTEKILAVPIDTSILAIRRKELEQVSWQSVIVEETMTLINVAYSKVQEAWSGAAHQLSEKLSAFQQMLSAEGIEATPEQELTQLILCGTCSNPTEQFLSHTLRSGGAKRFSKLFEQTFDNVDGLVFNHLQPAIQSLFTRLSQLEAMAAWKERAQVIGLSADHIKEAKATAGLVLFRVESLLQSLASHRAHLLDIFQWLQKAIGLLELDNEDAQQQQQTRALLSKLVYSETRVMHVLKTAGLSNDPILAIIGENETEESKRKARRPKLISRAVRARLFEDSFGPQDDFSLPSEPLVALLKRLESQLKVAFSSVGNSISNHITTSSASQDFNDTCVLVHNDATQIMNASLQTAGEDKIRLVYSLNSTLWILELEGKTWSWNVSGLDLPEESSAIALKFYSSSSLAIVYRDLSVEDSSSATLCMAPIDGLEYCGVELKHVNSSQGLQNFYDNIVMARPFEYTLSSLPDVKKRVLDKAGESVQLAVSAPRRRGGGLAALLMASGKRIVLLDFESDEDPDEAEEEAAVEEASEAE